MAFTASGIFEKVAGLPSDQRLHFYEVLGHNLTVAIRGIWSDDSISAVEKVDRMKWVNEIIHGTTAKVCVLRLKTHEWTEADFGSDIAHYISLNPGIAGEVSDAISRSFKAVTHNLGDAPEGPDNKHKSPG